MDPISGKALLGFGDYFVGGDKPASKGLTRGSVKPTVKLTQGARNSANSPAGKAVAGSAIAGQAAVAAAKAAKARAARYKPSEHAPIVKLKAAISPKGKVVLGAAPPAKLTPKQKTAVAKHANAIARNADVNRRLNISASRATAAGNVALAFARGAVPVLKRKFDGPSAKTRIGGEPPVSVGDDVGEDTVAFSDMLALYDTLGEMLGEDAPPPDAPPQGPDPLAGGGAGGLDPSSGIVTAPDGSVLYDPSVDPMVVPLPPRGEKMTDAEMKVVWQNVPDDGIPYGGAIPDGGIGSYSWFQTGVRMEDGILKSSGNASGYIYTRRGTWAGRNQDQPRWMAQKGDDQVHDVNDDGSIKDVGWMDFMLTALIPFYGLYKSPAEFAKFVSGGGDASAAKVAAASVGAGWGPIVGNPNGPLAGLQFAALAGKFFWQGKYCPPEQAAEVDAKTVEANRKTVAANTATAVTKSLQIAKDAADAAEKKAKQDAELALAQERIEAEKTQAQTRAETADITERQRQEAQKAQAEIDKQKAEAATEAAKAAADVEYQKAQDAQDAEKTRIDAEERRAALEQQREDARLAAEAARAALEQQREDARLATEAARAEQNQVIQEAAIYNRWAAEHPEEAVRQAQVPEDDGGDVFDDGGPSMFEEGALLEAQAESEDEV